MVAQRLNELRTTVSGYLMVTWRPKKGLLNRKTQGLKVALTRYYLPPEGR